MRPHLLAAVLVSLVACGGGGGGADPDGPALDAAGQDGPPCACDAPAADAGAPLASCAAAGEALCLDHATRRACLDTARGREWVDEACPEGAGCLAGACVAGACSDECNLGETDGARTCELHDLSSGTTVAPAPAAALHDRARAYRMWLERFAMTEGGVGSARFADPPAYTDVDYMAGIGDSAIWTGTYLAAEALRLRETGSADARASVRRLVGTLHLWFNVAGTPGLLARWAQPAGAVHPYTVGDLDCAGGSRRVHCDVLHAGARYDYLGHISRDQYQGVMLGYALAYEALGEHDEATRALIREDVVELLHELMRERDVPAIVTYDGFTFPRFDLHLRFAVLDPAEMTDGAVTFDYDPDAPDDAELWGFQEFMPDLAHLVRQLPGLGWVPTIPRAGSAIMLASFFRVGLLVTSGVPGWEAVHDELLAYYDHHAGQGGDVDDWLDVAETYSELTRCGENYYGHNIAMEPMYNLARLEDDPARQTVIRGSVLAGRMWSIFDTTKNTFFSFIYAVNVVGEAPDVVPSAVAQLAAFPPPPRVHVGVDLRDDPAYPHEPGCTDQLDHGTALDIAVRPVGDFVWQRHPWGLYEAEDLHRTEPGVDYLVAYWMGRWHDLLEDDRPGTCLVWR